MGNKIIFVTGGARSGKSSFALNEASRLKGKKAYIATAEALDKEMKERIEKHKKDRGNDWDTYEEPVKITSTLSNMKNNHSVVVLDCLTIWLSNILHRTQSLPTKQAGSELRTQILEAEIKKFLDTLSQFKNSSVRALGSGFCSLYIVSNEVGMGIVPDNKAAREFRDLAGLLNQKVAEAADEVYLVTAGIPVKIKNKK